MAENTHFLKGPAFLFRGEQERRYLCVSSSFLKIRQKLAVQMYSWGWRHGVSMESWVWLRAVARTAFVLWGGQGQGCGNLDGHIYPGSSDPC